jgi:hypothetical protein
MRILRLFERHPRADLSAYADGQLGWTAGERVEQHIETCDACRDELAALRAVRSALADLPRATSPRSFALTPEMAARPERAPVTSGTGPAFIAMRVAGAGVAAVLAVVVFIDQDDGADYSGDDDIAAWAPVLDNAERGSDLDAFSVPEMTMSQNLEVTAPTDDSGESDDDSPRPAAQPANSDAGGDTEGGGTTGGGSGGGVGGAPADGGSGMAGGPGGETDDMVTPYATFFAARITSTAIEDSAEDDDSGAAGAEALTDAMDDEDGGIGRMTIVQIVLAVVAAGALGGGFVLPLLLKRD